MNFKIYILGFFIALTGVACNKEFLDTAPYNGVPSNLIFNSDANARMAVNGIYQAAAQNAFLNNFIMQSTNMGPDGYSYGRANITAMFMGTTTSRDPIVKSMYTDLYRPIIYANDVIAGLTGNTKVTDSLRTRLIGEAKFFRGLCYFYLWNLFGDVVLMDKPMPVTETFLPRTAVAEIQALVINDFKDASDKLPVTYPAADLGRVTKGAAIAMLGKTYLYLQRWQEAATEFAKLLQAPYTYDIAGVNYGDSFYWQTQNNKESVFEIQYSMETGMGSVFDYRYGNRNVRFQGQDFCQGSMTALKVFTNNNGTPINISNYPIRASYPTGTTGENSYGKDLINWYDTTFKNVDLRLKESIILPGAIYRGVNDRDYKVYWPYNASTTINPLALRTTWTTIGVLSIRKFLTRGMESIINSQTGPTNFPMIRFADVLLMYAEALNEAQGPVAGVYSAVNRVRARAGVVNFPAGLTKDQMRREIWLERYRELMFETHLYFDVKRWHVAHSSDPVFGLNNKDELDFRFVKLLTKVFSEGRDYLFPIPGDEIDLNPKLTQNPGWN